MSTHAAQLGQIQSHSNIGTPLNATVGLWLGPRDIQQGIRLSVTPDITYRHNSNLRQLVERITAQIETDAAGRPYIRLASSVTINEPALAFRLKVFVGDQALMRNYSLTLNPAPVRTATKQSRSVARSRVSLEPITEASYTVAAGDTLWAIAKRVGGSANLSSSSLLKTIHAANPHAFVNGDIDRLKLGASLSLPEAKPVSETSSTPSSNVSTAAPITAVTETSIETNLAPLVTGQTTEATTNAVTATAPATTKVDWRTRKPEVAAELEALRLKYAALKARYDLQANESNSTPNALEATLSDAGTSSPDIELATLESPQVVSSTTSNVDVADVEKESTLATNRNAPAQDSLPTAGLSSLTMTIIGIVCLVLLALLGYRAFREVKTIVSKRRASTAHVEREEDFKAEVARKAANRIQMEGEVKRMLASRGQEESDAEVQPATPAALDLDTTAEIDQSIAHGRYAEAESLLDAVIAKSPRNYAAKLRLAEVLYMTERGESFSALANEINKHHRAELSDEEWRRIVRMGKIAAPTDPLFGGPRAVEGSAAAS